MAQAKNTLSTMDDEYLEQLSLWREVRAAINGKYKVIQLVTCLPNPQYKQYPIYSTMSKEQVNQATACNKANTLRTQSYWARGRFFNATGRTFESLGGMIWSKQPEVELTPTAEYLEDSANSSGSDLREVAQAVTDELVSIGRYGILVDMPSQPEGEDGSTTRLTQAEMEQPENAPRLIQYKAEQIIYFRLSNDSNKLEEVRLCEIVSTQKDEFTWEDETHTRRLVMIDGVYHNQLFNSKDELISNVTPKADGSTWDEIPFQFFGADDNSPSYSKVPLYDLANANLGHFVLDCDNRDNLHFHGQGMTNVFTDMSKQEFEESNPNGLDCGAKGRNLFNQGDSVELLQLEATGAIPAEMLRDEQRMVMLGAQVVTDSNSNQTLGAKEIDTNSSVSTLKRIAYNASEGLEQCIDWVDQFKGGAGGNEYRLNTDFITDNVTPEMVAKHFELVQGGVLPKASLYETARKVGFTKKTDDELKDEAEQDAAEIKGMGINSAIAQASGESE